MMALTAVDLADLRRWLFAGVVILLAHGFGAAAILRWHEPVDPAEPTGAIVVEFSPEQVVAPEQVQSDAVPEKPIEKVEKQPEQIVEAKGEEQVEEKFEPKLEEQPRQAVPVTTPPPPEVVATAALPAAPVEGTPSRPIDPRMMQTWVGQISAALERKKRYPPAAHARREQGVAQVSFTIDRQGQLIESHIARSSGVAELDQEALALLLRAQPFPPLPAEPLNGERISLTVPIRFMLK